MDRNAYGPWDVAVKVPDVECVSASQSTQPAPALYWIRYAAISVTPGSGAHDTTNDKVFSYAGSAFTWDPGWTVSTIVHVLFGEPADGAACAFPAASVAWV